MNRFARAVLVMLALALASATAAVAAPSGNRPSATLDSVASSVAGKPVDVWCETHWGDWIHAGDSVEEDWSYVSGFTFLSTPTVYIAPDVCETLHALLGESDVGLYHASYAIHTLVHEGVHQRGISNEGETDCTALSLFKQVAVESFGFAETETERYTATVTRRVKVAKRKFVTVRDTVMRTRQVPSRRLQAAYDYAVAWHRSAPAEYHGNC